MNDHEKLARWWTETYTKGVNTHEASPTVMVVGHEADGLCVSAVGEEPIDELAFFAGFMAYPCDAVYISTAHCTEAKVNGVRREAILTWNHLIATNETIVHVMALMDDGCLHIDAGEYPAEYFQPLHEACHEFDSFEIEAGEPDSRRQAREMVTEEGGIPHAAPYQVELLDPSEILNRARLVSAKRGW